ncbi:MAG: 16S rRNA (adenine(1518)-N(6)/adenine(1519)-N(6))-dimethyltransferase RsmA [Candidatus Methanomethylophilus sp.]|nr:16S rRNA (adenine(1518)-N(6)/adenine(1519)-N(6))-dimethyltransferase RsmA [Methanomethylophilus sp.]MDD3232699.1 16S rRNA (adenine(1518)-N(6)/adenine(1519)-N(6))-dimethyltransferase RsmA [Methanomethylophilus sp.]MDD4221531.1 16S rRNA (adenine(1518)-N(6)/adenine(1519)-N(6))-dimethyltransferase RsmA [Methanomethylophilus sp.]MDD4668362.1 16S rRNA (adenine(1518)-N(6)/adenine(1519)-N(6))-dimethyltransferase RsmA [Methanomethylophilus sp.]
MSEETGRLIRQTGVIPRKSRGQNFLTDGRIADRHVGYADIQPGDRILEIGPGLGVLTRRLVKTGGQLTCIEIDPALADYIKATYGSHLTLIRGDATKVEFPPFDRFVSNLPYSVSTPIIFKLLAQPFKKAVVMVQKEFADRMVANVGSPDYSRLTVNLFYRAECAILENVPRSRFKPQPRVDSCLVSIVPRPAPFAVKDEATFFTVVKACFDHRRKQIGTGLKTAGLITAAEGIPYTTDRIEMLRPAEIAEIADAVWTLHQQA